MPVPCRQIGDSGSCSVVDGGDIFWANELRARNNHMVVGNLTLFEACQHFGARGSSTWAR